MTNYWMREAAGDQNLLDPRWPCSKGISQLAFHAAPTTGLRLRGQLLHDPGGIGLRAQFRENQLQCVPKAACFLPL
jgi:hypothetical protein